MEGENYIRLIGKIVRPKLQQVGQYNTSLFKGSLAIPTPDNKHQYIKIAAWGELAEALDEVLKNEYIKVIGHLEESSFDGKCRHCNGVDRKYWTECVVDFFTILKEEGVENDG